MTDTSKQPWQTQPQQQEQHHYYYLPLKDEGPFAERLQKLGEFVGGAIADAFAQEETGGEMPEVSMVAKKLGEAAGGMAGNAVGLYIDNASAIMQNVQTFIDQLNDPRTWSDPSASALSDGGGP